MAKLVEKPSVALDLGETAAGEFGLRGQGLLGQPRRMAESKELRGRQAGHRDDHGRVVGSDGFAADQALGPESERPGNRLGAGGWSHLRINLAGAQVGASDGSDSKWSMSRDHAADRG